jgi:hypothetical protein
MVVLVVHVLSIAVDEAEGYPSVCLHGDCPLAFALTSEFVESEAGNIHISNGPRFIELGQNEAKSLGMDGLNLCRTPSLKEQR